MSACPSIDLRLPTRGQIVAYLLRSRQGLTDSQIGEVLGICRESANKRIARARRAIDQLRAALPEVNWDALALLNPRPGG